MSKPRTIRIPTALEKDLEREFTLRGVKEWSTGIVELLTEAVRMRRVPGIGFADSITGRRAVLAGTGLEIWEVVALWRALNGNEEELRQAFSWLSPGQLRSALAYYRLFPDEIDARIGLEEGWTVESIREHLSTASLGPGLQGKSD